MISCSALMSTKASCLLLLAAVAAACGGGSSGPTSPGTPTPTPGSPVGGFVFYDENGNGIADPTETVRLPNVGVTIGGASATTQAGGRFSLSSPGGAQTAQASPASLPAYFTPGAPVSVTVPTSGDVAVPVVLALGPRATPNLYLAFGDSITWGQGSSDGTGYASWLREDLRAFWGKGDVAIDGVPGTKSNKGESRLGPSLSANHPAYLLILYGTNDWNDADCRNAPPCYTVDALRSMVLQAHDAGAFPVVGTIPPVNPNYTDKDAADRNDWVKNMNTFIRTMASQERAPVAEVYGNFMKQSSLPPLFADELHPNDSGFQIIAQSFFDAITKPISASASARARRFSFSFSRPGHP